MYCLIEEKPKNSQHDVNVYMIREKKGAGACKRLHFEYREMAAVCQGECSEFCELRRGGELENRPVLREYSLLRLYTVREKTGLLPDIVFRYASKHIAMFLRRSLPAPTMEIVVPSRCTRPSSTN
jgi:hypothetical protein